MNEQKSNLISQPQEQLCKLTKPDRTTFRGFLWTPGKWVETSGHGPLCTDGWIHIYEHPTLAVVFNPIHANFHEPIAWRIEIGGSRLNDHGIKTGVSRCRLIEEIDLPKISLMARVRWVIELSLLLPQNPTYTTWAQRWIKGEDRSFVAAEAAVKAVRKAQAEAAARMAAWAAAAEAARVAEAAAFSILEILEAAIKAETVYPTADCREDKA